MPAQVITSVENNFTKGLITEATGLNFPENAATSATNCTFTLIGDVIRREGINEELNGTTVNINRALSAMTSYVWNNPGGDGNSKLLVKQVGKTLYFYNIATSTIASPLSTQQLAQTVDLSLNTVSGSSFDISKEAAFADGNGYLIVYHPSCEPGYILYNPGTQSVSLNQINVQIRDFQGLNDGLAVNTRPLTLTNEHNYNIQNQGWTSGNTWATASVSSVNISSTTNYIFTVPSGISGISNGQTCTMQTTSTILHRDPANGNPTFLTNITVNATGTVVSYSGTSLTINVFTFSYTGASPYYANPNNHGGPGNEVLLFGSPQWIFIDYTPWSIASVNTNNISTWFSAESNYPSNADVWWYFKDNTGTFAPGSTQPSVTLATGNAPQGHFILPAFNMNRTAVSGISNLTTVSTTVRPNTGCWFQGRVWYTGVSASQATIGDAQYYTWTENIYYSTTITSINDFGICYQQNDPTSENLNGELPTDGGVLQVVGSGTIHKLFPIVNGLLVFANNGVWFITGSQGIGFASNDFTITQLSKIKCLSRHSFIDVNGLPFFWNEEGIYQVMPQQGGQLAVEPITVGTILSFYNNIPLASKKYARGSYDPINYTIQWCYRSTIESSTTDRYQFDSILNFNTYNKAFFPYTVSAGPNTNFIHDVVYISYPFISNATPEPDFKYPTSSLISDNYLHTFAEEYDTNYVDWGSVNYTSQFITGYKLHGQGLMKVQVPYIYTYSRTNQGYQAFYLQSIYDYAADFDSNRWTQRQFVELNDANATMVQRRHKLRGQGYAIQIMITSVAGQPFDLMGWALYETRNTGV